jgi:hypothetical protein
MSYLIKVQGPDNMKGSTLQLSGSRNYRVASDGTVEVERANLLEVMNLGFWPVSTNPQSPDYDPGDLVPVLNSLLNQGL